MNTIVIATYLPGEAPPIQYETKYETHQVVCSGLGEYWDALAAHWDTDDTIVNVEHDMELTEELVDRLVNCPRPLCAHAYPVRLGDTGTDARRKDTVGEFLECNSFWPFTAEPGGHWITEPTDEVAWAGPGFIKVTKSARVRFLRKAIWTEVEQSINDAVSGPWHLHWPAVRHYQ